MTTPIQVVPVPGIGEELQKAIGPLIETYQRRQQLELQQEELKLRQQQLKQQQTERQEQQAQLGATGEMLRTMLVAQDQEQVTMPDVPSIPSPIGMGSAFMSLEGGRQVTGLGPIAMAARAAPAMAIPQAVDLSRDIRQQIVEQRAGRRVDATLQGVLKTIPDADTRGQLSNYIALKRNGADLPVGMEQTLFPNLFQTQGVDPALMRSALGYLAVGGLSWREVAAQHKIPLVAGGIPGDFTAPVTTAAGPKMNERQMVAQFHYRGLALSGPQIDNLVYGIKDAQGNVIQRGTGGLNLTAVTKRAFDAAAASGNSVTSFLGAIAGFAANGMIPPEQQQLLTLTSEYATSLKYLMTGAQANAQEVQVTQNNVTELSNDNPHTMANKKAYRQTMTEAAQDLAEGKINRQQGIGRLQQRARELGLSADFIKMLDAWQREAQTNGNEQTQSFNRSNDPSQQMTMEEWAEYITNNIGKTMTRNQMVLPP